MHGKERYTPMINADDDSDEEHERSTVSDSSASVDRIHLEPKKGCTKFMFHLRLLLYKNVLLFWRSKKITLFQLLTPILSCIVILFLQTIANDFQDLTFPNPPIETLAPMRKCMGKD